MAYKFQVGVADDERTATGIALHDMLGVELAGILQGLIIVAETAHLHVLQTAVVADGDFKVAHHEVGKVIAGQFEE